MRYETGWAIFDAATGKPVLFDYRMPVYWLRRLARRDAREYGWEWQGKTADVVIRRVSLKVIE